MTDSNIIFTFKLESWQNYLTHLIWLVHTSFLPSSWNLDKNFALTGELGQVHMAKKYFQFFSMREDGYSILLLNLWFSWKLLKWTGLKAQQLQKKNAAALKFLIISIMKPSEFFDQKSWIGLVHLYMKSRCLENSI